MKENGDSPPVQKGSLLVVGTGIQLINHATHEAINSIERADKVVYSVADYPTQRWIEKLNPTAESLQSLYASGKPRIETYGEMAEVIMKYVRDGLRVCAVFYGHPGVFVRPSHEAIRKAKEEGYEARMLPGISAEDCLFADLGLDPGSFGCQSYEATDFLIHTRKFDPSSILILWQIGVIGVLDSPEADVNRPGLRVLTEVLKKFYGCDHEAIIYSASPFPYPVAGPSIQKVRIGSIPEARVTPISTLCVLPIESTLDHEMVTRLHLD